MPKESEDKIDACEAANPAASSSVNASDKDPGNSCTAEKSQSNNSKIDEKGQEISNNTVSTNVESEPKISSSPVKIVKAKKVSPPIVFNCLYTEYDVIKESGEEVGWKLSFEENEEYDVYWSDLPLGSEKLSKMKNYQKINHFPSMYQICRKNLLAKNLKKMERMFTGEYKFTPKTWLLPYEYQ